MNFENAEIRMKMLEAKVTHKEVAEVVGVTRQTFSKLMRYPLSEKRKADVLAALETLTTLTKDR